MRLDIKIVPSSEEGALVLGTCGLLFSMYSGYFQNFLFLLIIFWCGRNRNLRF